MIYIHCCKFQCYTPNVLHELTPQVGRLMADTDVVSKGA